MAMIEVFSWGYYGWGSETKRLVRAVDAAEVARGFAPPVFVDIRISRKVRAAGFRENTFGKLLGPDCQVAPEFPPQFAPGNPPLPV